MTTHTHARFWIDGLPNALTVDGWHDSAQRWNGWTCPAFDFDTAQRIAQWLDEARAVYKEQPYLRYVAEIDAFIEWYDGEDVATYNAFECACDDGQTRKLYGIGAYYWVWSLDSD